MRGIESGLTRPLGFQQPLPCREGAVGFSGSISRRSLLMPAHDSPFGAQKPNMACRLADPAKSTSGVSGGGVVVSDGCASCAAMIRSELAARLADLSPHLYAKDCEAVVDAILGQISDAIAAGDRVELRGFGSFTIVESRARMGRNPRSGALACVEAKSKLVFKTGKKMRDRLNPEAAMP